MKHTRNLYHTLVAMLLLSLGVGASWSQSNNPQAVDWFEIGLKENNLTKKIAAYTKAVEADPNFFEALNNLGLAYKQKQDYANAEKFLQLATQAWPREIQNEAKTRLYYELATAYKRNGKFERAEATLLQAKNLAPSNTLQGALAAELGRLWYEQNRYNEALTELRASVQLNPENQAKVSGLIGTIESAMALQQLYTRALTAKQSGNVEEAKTLFEQIRAINPSFKDVTAQLAQLSERQPEAPSKVETSLKPVAREEANTETARLYEEARRFEAEGKLDAALASYEKLFAQTESYKDARLRMQESKQKLEEARTQAQLEEQYIAGNAALKARDWTRAVVIFERILSQQREYRDTRRRLLEAQKGLERESSDAIIARYYADGVAAMKREDLGSALAAFEKVRSFNPNYRDVASRWSEVDKLLQHQNAPATHANVPAPAATLVDSLYREGLEAFGKEDWMRAVVTLEKLQLVQPNYREVASLLAQSRAHLPKPEENLDAPEEAASNTGAIYLGGFALLLAVGAGFIFFSPAARARLQLMRGNEAKAVAIYEKQVARHPNRVSLYPTLARLYLREGRKDERALKVYKAVLQLNLATSQREELNAVVAQQFLQEGRTDSDAIEVLEKQLAVEINRQNRLH